MNHKVIFPGPFPNSWLVSVSSPRLVKQSHKREVRSYTQLFVFTSSALFNKQPLEGNWRRPEPHGNDSEPEIRVYLHHLLGHSSQTAGRTPLGTYQMLCLPDVYSRTHNSSTITVVEQQQSNFVAGGHHHMRSCSKASQCEEG